MANVGKIGISLLDDIKQVLAENKGNFRQGLLNRGIYTEDEVAELEKAIANPKVDVRDRNIAINLQGKDLKKFLKDGQYKTQFETPLTGRRKDYNINGRNTAESEWFGKADRFEEPNKAAIYGYFDNPENSSGARMYGNVKMTLKPGVKDRATMTFGDSFNNFNSYNVFTAPSTEYDIGLLGSDNSLWAGADRFCWWEKKGVDKERPWQRIGPPEQWELEDMNIQRDNIKDRIQRKINAISEGKGTKIDEYADGRKFEYPDYVEAQIHGGLTPADIQSIQLDETIDKLPPKWKKLADENGFSFIDKDGNCIYNCK